MKYYIAFDGGGTKLQGILFNSEACIIAEALSGGVNLTIHSKDTVMSRIDGCVTELLEKAAAAGFRIDEISAVTASLAGGISMYFDAVSRHVPCREYIHTGEGLLGVLTSGLTTGLCALSGTGSDIFYIKNYEELDVLGGWGYYLGDDGSGTWIGRKAVRSLLRVLSGIEPASLLHEMMKEETDVSTENDVFDLIYKQPSIASYIGTFCKTVNAAASRGDLTAVGILREAGEELAGQTCDMMEKHCLPGNMQLCVTGSVFRHCDIMRESFLKMLREEHPDIRYYPPLFSPVIGGMIWCLLKNGFGGNPPSLSEEFWNKIEKNCGLYRI